MLLLYGASGRNRSSARSWTRRNSLPTVASERDSCANFERMRRQMDELFGDVFDRGWPPCAAAGSRRRSTSTTRPTRRARSCAPTSRASTPTRITLEIRGRELVLSGQRRPRAGEERVYQQLEIEHGPFRRVVALGADVDADAAAPSYEDGILRVELPLAAGARPRSVPIGQRGDGAVIDGRPAATASPRSTEPPRCPATLPVLPLRDTVTFPDTLTPLAVGQERSVRLVNDVLGGDRMLVMVASRDPEARGARARAALRRRRRRRRSRACSRCPTARCGCSSRAPSACASSEWIRRGALPRRARHRAARHRRRRARSSTALMRNVQPTFAQIIEQAPYLPEELQMAVANVDDPSALAT